MARARAHGRPPFSPMKASAWSRAKAGCSAASTSMSAPRDRLALIGRNGAGKTTLLKCLAGLIETDEGRRTIVPGTKVVLLEQDPDMSGHATLADWVLAGEDAPAPHEADGDRRAARDRPRAPGARPPAAASGGGRRSSARWRRSPTCCCSTSRPTISTSPRSTGWRTGWTASRARSSSSATTAPSSTRLTKSCLWLDRGKLRRAEIGFGGFDAWTEAVYAEEARAADKLDAKLKLELHWLQRGVTARRRRNQGRLAKLHEMRAQRAAMLGAAGHRQAGAGQGRREDQDGDRRRACRRRASASAPIIRDFTLRVQRGDRIGIVGANGAGKTTLLQAADRRDRSPTAARSRRPRRCTGIVIDQQRKLMAPGQARARRARRGRRLDRRSRPQEAHQGLSEGIPVRPVADRGAGRLAVGRRAVAAAAGARVRARRRTCWCSTSRPTTSTSKRSTCCRK